MGHEVIVFGAIEGADGERFHALNLAELAAVPAEDEWPWLVRGMFAPPVEWPHGTYRSQVIHFGGSFKDEPGDRACWDAWIGKLEALLRRLCWWSATLHLRTEFEPERMFRWLPSEAAVVRMAGDPPQPVQDWQRSVIVVEAN